VFSSFHTPFGYFKLTHYEESITLDFFGNIPYYTAKSGKVRKYMVTQTHKNYSNKLREVRTREGLKVTELSRLCLVSEKTIRDIEKGKYSSTEVTKQKILKGLNNNPLKSKQWNYEEIFGGNP
jgi:DNA-binding XRE family transcriptional regulator